MPNQGEDCYFFFYSTCTKVRIGISKSVLSMISLIKLNKIFPVYQVVFYILLNCLFAVNFLVKDSIPKGIHYSSFFSCSFCSPYSPEVKRSIAFSHHSVFL